LSNETAAVAQQHHDANIILMPARFVSHKHAIETIDTFLEIKSGDGMHIKGDQKIEL